MECEKCGAALTCGNEAEWRREVVEWWGEAQQNEIVHVHGFPCFRRACVNGDLGYRVEVRFGFSKRLARSEMDQDDGCLDNEWAGIAVRVLILFMDKFWEPVR